MTELDDPSGGGAAGGPRGDAREDDGSSRVALMEMALGMLERDGVLSGLNLSEVAKRVGVTPANVYHFFGSRRGLLREGLLRLLASLAPQLAQESKKPWSERQLEFFRLVRSEPRLRLVSLLALDGSDELTLPFLDRVRTLIQRDLERGHLDPEADAEMAHIMLFATALGYVVVRESVASRLATPVEDLDGRADAVFRQLVEAFAPAGAAPPASAGSSEASGSPTAEPEASGTPDPEREPSG